MTIHQLYPEIQKNPIFEDSSPCSVDQYLTEQVLSVLEFLDGSIVYSSTEHQNKIGMIIQGTAQVYTGTPGDQILLNTLRAGDMFGIANLYIEDEPFPTIITARDSCKIVFMDRDAVCQLIENDPVITKNFLRFQSKKIMYLNRKIMTFTAGSAERKLFVFLTEHAEDGIFTPTCSMSTLANMLGIGRASLYRGMDHLIGCGWIKKQGKRIYILNHDALAELI